jgi:hypothetical protein
MTGETNPAARLSCMGGWCKLRDKCARHHAIDRRRPVDRLCETGEERPEALVMPIWGKHSVSEGVSA